MLVGVLNVIANLGFQHVERNPLTEQTETAFLLGIGVSDPFRDVTKPGRSAVAFQLPDEVLIAEVIQAAEDLANHADERNRGIVSGRDATESLAAALHGLDKSLELACRVGATRFHGVAKIAKTEMIGGIGPPWIVLVGANAVKRLP